MRAASRRWPLLLACVALLACLALIARTPVVSDLSAFMPRKPSLRQQLLLDQFRDGMVARMVLVGIEGADAAERARLSRALADRLRARPALFAGVQNGDAAGAERDAAFVFAHRYVLAPDALGARFSAGGLRAAVQDSLDALATDSGVLLRATFTRDPTGEAARIVEELAGQEEPPRNAGVWSSPDGRRAMLLVQTRAPGSDLDGQARAAAAIGAEFAALAGPATTARLLLSGTGVLSVAARAAVEGEIARLALASLALVTVLLLAVYRSATLLVLGLLPVLCGACVGIAAVSLGFGRVHSLTLGFGSTLIGEAVDYSIYFFLQNHGEAPRGFWRTIALGVLTSVTGYCMLLFSGFTSLAQLGLYSICGLIAAALVARQVLPLLLPPGLRLPELAAASAAVQALFAGLRRLRWLLFAGTVLAVAGIALHSGTIWNRQLIALSPVPQDVQRIDADLRRGLGLADLRYVAVFSAADAQAGLRRAEQAGAVLRGLLDQGVLGGYLSPAQALPSLQQQAAQRAALPAPRELKARFAAALRGLPLRAEDFGGFVDDVAAARAAPDLARADLNGTSFALLADSLLVARARDVLVLLPLYAPAPGAELDTGRVAAALAAAGLDDVGVIDILGETTRLFADYLREALLLVAIGSVLVALFLALALRSWRRCLRVLAPLGAAVACVVALQLACGVHLTILHLVGLLLVVGIGSNYALFFDRAAIAAPGSAPQRMPLSLVVANLTAVGSFGLLGLSRVGVLSALGSTVGLGALLSLVFAASWIAPARARPS